MFGFEMVDLERIARVLEALNEAEGETDLFIDEAALWDGGNVIGRIVHREAGHCFEASK